MSGYDKGEAGLTGIRTYHWYRERPSSDPQTQGPTLTTAFQLLNFTDDDTVADGGFVSTYVEVVNDDVTNSIYVSWDGVHRHWTIKAGEIKTFPYMRERFIYLMGQAGGEPYRVSAW